MSSHKTTTTGVILGLALSVGLTSVGPAPACAGPAKPHGAVTAAELITAQAVTAQPMTDVSAARKKRRHVHRGDGGAAAAAAFAGIVGTIGTIAAAQARRDYYERNYYYGYGRPRYYYGPPPVEYGYGPRWGYGY